MIEMMGIPEIEIENCLCIPDQCCTAIQKSYFQALSIFPCDGRNGVLNISSLLPYPQNLKLLPTSRLTTPTYRLRPPSSSPFTLNASLDFIRIISCTEHNISHAPRAQNAR